MAKRMKVRNKRRDRKYFSKTAERTNRKNVSTSVRRGGTRL